MQAINFDVEFWLWSASGYLIEKKQSDCKGTNPMLSEESVKSPTNTKENTDADTKEVNGEQFKN